MRYTRRFVLIWLGCASGLSLIPRHVRARALRANPDELAATLHRLDARVRGEFASGTTVQLNGWVLSRTEARLCALYR
jgi:hypothetical protein